MELVKGGKRFGAAAIELGVLKQDQIYAYISKQVDEIVFATLTVSDARSSSSTASTKRAWCLVTRSAPTRS